MSDWEKLEEHVTVSMVFVNHEGQGFTRGETLRVEWIRDLGGDSISVRGVELESGTKVRIDILYGESK
jgi:hypothetical protein